MKVLAEAAIAKGVAFPCVVYKTKSITKMSSSIYFTHYRIRIIS